MLRALHIRNYILIDSLDIEFPEGLVIITGQTGAGKSILIGALGLLAGGKADPSMIGGDAADCVVEGEFETAEGLRIVRRVIYRSGRSRCFIDDCPVQIQELSSLCDRLIDIHSQHKSLLLTDKAFQLSLLDSYAGNDGLLEECRRLWTELGECRKELEEVSERLKKSRAGHDYNQSRLGELEAAGLKGGEIEELEEEQKALANAEEIRERLAAAVACFTPRDAEGISASLQEARRQIEHAGRYLPSVLSLAQRLNSARIELEDILAEIEAAAESAESPGMRLETVEQRLSLLYRLMKKHGCASVEELMELRDSLAGEISGTEELEEKCRETEQRLAATEKAYESCSGKLSAARREAAGRFGAEVEGHLHFLELERASFEVEVNPRIAGACGSDEVCFKFAADGRAGVDVAKCASGGEISRIMLSLKAMMAPLKGMPTLIFDEIDSGVSGSVADKMGSMICEIGRSMQVFSITHLPQVAAKGSAHYLVSKHFDDAAGHDVSGITLLEGEDRVREIARLLSGSTITPEALANARALINEN